MDEEVDVTIEMCRMWRQMYNNCLREGFNEKEAMELVKQFVHSSIGRHQTGEDHG